MFFLKIKNSAVKRNDTTFERSLIKVKHANIKVNLNYFIYEYSLKNNFYTWQYGVVSISRFTRQAKIGNIVADTVAIVNIP